MTFISSKNTGPPNGSHGAALAQKANPKHTGAFSVDKYCYVFLKLHNRHLINTAAKIGRRAAGGYHHVHGANLMTSYSYCLTY